MKKQIKIILNPEIAPSKKGDLFEDLVRHIFETQRYEIDPRVNFTGMEIDLIADHKDRSETAYIECKARDRLESDDIKRFSFNVNHRNEDYGYFLSTTEFEHQVAGLIEEMSDDEKYSNLYFWGPSKIFGLLESAKVITPLDVSNIKYTITKTILCYTYFGLFYVLILRKNTMPTHFCVYDAKNVSTIQKNEMIENLKKHLPEIKDLNLLSFPSENNATTDEGFNETIAEVQESENWYDYLPASSKDFIGRKDKRKELFDFIEQASSKKTSRRVFYIDGKSGWGKSSLITDLRSRSKNKFHRNQYFVLAVDARSASSSNFVALAFKKLVNKAMNDKFIQSTFDFQKLDIVSGFDILGSESAHQLIKDLDNKNKTLILIFDQFEDVFRKPGLYKAFHKFLHDVDEIKSNIILGFSWKSEINIPIEHEAYYLWQQDKDFAFRISMPEFNSSEINGVINQLEKSIKKPIDLDLKRRLIESSQGFPWLIKKLCIHTYKQIISGKTIESLVEQELNCEALFNDDLEGLLPKQIDAVKYIAKRSFEGDFFDATEIDDKIDDYVISTLIDQRLVVKLGTKYNVYWDIFRDYLVTEEVPPIGESYILRQYVNVCVDVYKLFENEAKLNLDELKGLHPKHPGTKTLDNILRELRSVGLVQKVGDYFQRSHPDIPATEDGFRKHMAAKFTRYTPYQRLLALGDDISESEVISTLKDIFKGTSFEEKTWKIYSKYLISWFEFADLDISDRFIGFRKRRYFTNLKPDFIPNKSPEKDISVFCEIKDKTKYENNSEIYKSLYDLKSLGLIDYHQKTMYLTEKGKLIQNKCGTKEIEKAIAIEAMKTARIKQSTEYFFRNPMCTRKELGEALPTLTNNIKSEEYKRRVNQTFYGWAKFVFGVLDESEIYSLNN